MVSYSMGFKLTESRPPLYPLVQARGGRVSTDCPRQTEYVEKPKEGTDKGGIEWGNDGEKQILSMRLFQLVRVAKEQVPNLR